MTLSKPQIAFFHLLRLGTDQEPASDAIDLLTSLSDEEWQDVVRLVQMQLVSAFVYHALLALPQEARPPKKYMFSLCLASEGIERYNLRISKLLEKLDKVCRQEGLRFALLKGHGNGVNYPNPLYRPGGDIDLYVYLPEDQKKLNAWARQKGYKFKKDNLHHSAFTMDGIMIENHWVPTYFGMYRFDRRLKKDLQQIISQNDFARCTIHEGLEVDTLPHAFNAFFIFQHLFHHFMVAGIGLKQVMDWQFYWQRHQQEIDAKQFVEIANRYGELYAMRVFAALTVKYLGADPKIYPFLTSEDLADPMVEKVLMDIIEGGNLGKISGKASQSQAKWVKKYHSFVASMRRMKEVRSLAPHLINPLPIVRVVYNIKLMLSD